MSFELSVVVVVAHDLQDAADVGQFSGLANEVVSVLGDFFDVRVGGAPVVPQARRHPDAEQPTRFASCPVFVPNEVLLILSQTDLDHRPGFLGHGPVLDFQPDVWKIRDCQAHVEDAKNVAIRVLEDVAMKGLRSLLDFAVDVFFADRHGALPLPLIVLNGPPQVGKSTLARSLKLAGAQQIVLNRPFTKFVQESLGLNNVEFEAGKDSVLPGYDAPIRKALIAAADAIELVDPNVWVSRAFDYVSENMIHRDVWVLDSVGKKSQMIWLQNNVRTPIILVNVGRPGVDHGGWLAADTIMYDDIPHCVPNTFEDGREDVRGVMFERSYTDHLDNFWNDGDLASVDAYASQLLTAASGLKG